MLPVAGAQVDSATRCNQCAVAPWDASLHVEALRSIMANMQTVYARNEAFVYREIGGEALLVPIYGQVADMESIYTLSEVGARIWSLMDGKRTLAEVRDALLEEYEVPPGELEADLGEFVHNLMSIEALRPV